MNKHEVFVGVDISKKTLDISLGSDGNYDDHRIDNTTGSIRKFFKKHLNEGFFIIGMENTGRYNWPLLSVLSDHCFKVFVINPLHISKSLGLVRGKDDRTDAKRICNFIGKNHAELTPWKPKRKVIDALGVLISERRRLKKMKTQTLCAQKDFDLLDNGPTKKALTGNNRGLIKDLNKHVRS
ncbi:MAG: transposase [Flavobacteriales bacterium]|nr:transposase [Flavobacteriales bacterium]